MKLLSLVVTNKFLNHIKYRSYEE